MDMKALRKEAVEATSRFFLDSRGGLPEEGSEEWEEAYRRQLELAKKRYADAPPVAPLSEEGPVEGPALSGPPAQQRWAATIRTERAGQIQSKEMRDWLLDAWRSSKTWIDTRDLAPPAFLRRVEAQYAEHRRQSEREAAERRTAQQAKAAAEQSLQRELQAAGITAAGLVELIDVSVRVSPLPRERKLAEVVVDGRNLRIFETGDAAVLMVIENNAEGRREYAIERDKGLVGDLELFARGMIS